jgi:asparagine synthase (glutamine-hydrolysing)
MRNQLLRDADWAGMAHSVEIRTPFVDIDLLMSVAPWLSAFPDIKKAEAFGVASLKLPNNILKKSKTGFAIPISDWLIPRNQPLRNKKNGLQNWAKHVRSSYIA